MNLAIRGIESSQVKYNNEGSFLNNAHKDLKAVSVLSKGSLTSNTSGEGEIRKAIIEARLIDCIVNLPSKLFLNTQLPACLWFLSQNKGNGKFRYRKDEILFLTQEI